MPKIDYTRKKETYTHKKSEPEPSVKEEPVVTWVPSVTNCINTNQDNPYQNNEGYLLQFNPELNQDELDSCKDYIRDNYTTMDYEQIYNARRRHKNCNNPSTLASFLDIHTLAPNQMVYYDDGSNTYCFAYEDIDYLLESGTNPYTTLPLSDEFEQQLLTLADDLRKTIPPEPIDEYYPATFDAIGVGGRPPTVNIELNRKIDQLEEMLILHNKYVPLRSFIDLTDDDYRAFLSGLEWPIDDLIRAGNTHQRNKEVLVEVLTDYVRDGGYTRSAYLAYGIDEYMQMKGNRMTFHEFRRHVVDTEEREPILNMTTRYRDQR